MRTLPTINPPADISSELRRYLLKMFEEVNSSIYSADEIEPRTRMPERPVIGKIYFFKNVIGTIITEEGWWGYKSTGWVQLG